MSALDQQVASVYQREYVLNKILEETKEHLCGLEKQIAKSNANTRERDC